MQIPNQTLVSIINSANIHCSTIVFKNKCDFVTCFELFLIVDVVDVKVNILKSSVQVPAFEAVLDPSVVVCTEPRGRKKA